ncbi:hypothetical protein AGABI1DRAFT_106739 [Agaricus bisporus var. burnettii JB137-S8]|uniref:IgA peptidase M64-domain-containing protein n=1 Tax=Agaricus bisporus var. burnettii (strain JB137-S8 / ATCC MYA-4627 / FGSC 10392) TaxID=597362 RepID=K5VXH2_AGABU|nr:uncharacterized protein AGABI1DRAFT_106739 [Agaricus bisporus var. burnettii JB137-S8]EKM79164.1 hypothetical protein AGABI1DRAFT_106739 [Agaricus bisporus var. burnettii JB137-S8]
MVLNRVLNILLFGLGVQASTGYLGDAQQQPMSMSKTGESNVCAMHGGSLPSFGYAKDGSHSVSALSPTLAIRPLAVSGPPENRVDLVFFSDGYTIEEMDKFFTDAKRLADDISQNQTFFTVRPLLNFWGAFTPSEESGIGADGVPKKTPYGLYREGTELRAVYYARPEVAHAACDSMGDQCNYPILLGNDPLYGGLGGEFTVITSSILNGPLVLRHELGHSIIDVGEEYDGGFAYFGVNAVQDAHEPVSWDHWLSIPPSTSGSINSDARVERSVMPMQTYPWTLLNTTQSWSIKFPASGLYFRHVVRFSLSGLPEATDLRVELDGIELDWVPKEGLGLDRWHYDIHRDGGLSDGEHILSFTLLNQEREGVAQLCSAEILEFGDEDEFVSSPGFYSLYPTFSDKNETSYRPTNEDCLMRIVTSPDLCKVCTEGLWIHLLKSVNLIDDLTESCTHSSSTWTKILTLDLVPLAHLRNPEENNEPINNESYAIIWKKDGIVLDEFANMTSIAIEDNDNNDQVLGRYEVFVKFSTDEIRLDEEGRTSSSRVYDVTTHCEDD